VLAAALLAGDDAAIGAATIELHGIVDRPDDRGQPALAADVRDSARRAALAAVAGQVGGTGLPAVRGATALALRRAASVIETGAAHTATRLVDELIDEGRLVRDGDRVREAGQAAPSVDASVAAAMDRLEAALDVLAPPGLDEATRRAGCPATGVRDLERAARIVVLAPDLAYAMPMYRRLAASALELAGRGPLTPAAFRDATGTSRRYVMPILEDLDRRGILRRTPAGHLPGPRAPTGIGGVR
jgi:selenocysteine-specific elongation factor